MNVLWQRGFGLLSRKFMNEYFQAIYFAGLDNFSKIFIFLAVVVICVIVRWYKSMQAWKILVAPKWRDRLVLHGSVFRKVLKNFLFFIGFLFVAIAILRPQWDKKNEKVEQESRDLLIAVDISRSMLGTDVKPCRLEFAKKKIKKLLANLSCERVGLLLFSGETVLQCPLTKDYSTFFMFLDQLDVETISSGTTTLDGAISQALAIFENMPTKRTKLLCLFTDGEDFSTNLACVKDKAAQAGLSIFTFGIGTKHGAPVPIFDYQAKQIGFEKDSSGKIIMSKLNEGILKNLAEQTGGKYIHALPESERDIQEFITLVHKFEKDALEDAHVQRFQEQYPYAIVVSLICFVVEWLL